MTSASELFYPRRSRVGRSSTELDLDPSDSDRSFFHNYHRRLHHHHNRDRRDLDGCDPRRNPHFRHPCNRLSALPDHASLWADEDTGPFVGSTSIGAETFSSTSSPRLAGHERLPVAVQHARARLVERLSGVTLSADRQRGRPSSGTYNGEIRLGNNLRLVGSGHREPDVSTGWSSGSSFGNFRFQTRRGGSYKNKPPGLTPEALDCLQLEVFSCQEKDLEGENLQISYDCSICLESFEEGDKLIRLPCDHRFHSACLDPWVRTCGDCPYCRRDIAAGSWSIRRT